MQPHEQPHPGIVRTSTFDDDEWTVYAPSGGPIPLVVGDVEQRWAVLADGSVVVRRLRLRDVWPLLRARAQVRARLRDGRSPLLRDVLWPDNGEPVVVLGSFVSDSTQSGS